MWRHCVWSSYYSGRQQAKMVTMWPFETYFLSAEENYSTGSELQRAASLAQRTVRVLKWERLYLLPWRLLASTHTCLTCCQDEFSEQMKLKMFKSKHTRPAVIFASYELTVQLYLIRHKDASSEVFLCLYRKRKEGIPYKNMINNCFIYHIFSV